MLDYFYTGRVLVALDKRCIYDGIPTNHDNPIFDGIEVIKIEVLFEPQSLSADSRIGALILIHLECQQKITVIETIQKLETNPSVVHARPDLILTPHNVPNDKYYRYLWGLDHIHAPMAWNYSTGNPRVITGVLDSGIDYQHPDLKENMWNAPQGLHGWNFVTDDYNVTDETGHGTHVAGTIGAIGNNIIGVTGICWRVNIASLKIGNTLFSTVAAIKAIDYANKNRISILNGSWGTGVYCPILRYAIDNYDGLFITSAGNSGRNIDLFPVYPASYECRNIITVAAAAPNNYLAPFSNYSPKSVDIAAPGVDIFSTDISGGYSYMDGTSMAAPYVAGAAALLKSYRPDLSFFDIKNIILSCADKQPQFFDRVLAGGTLNLNTMMEIATYQGDICRPKISFDCFQL